MTEKITFFTAGARHGAETWDRGWLLVRRQPDRATRPRRPTVWARTAPRREGLTLLPASSTYTHGPPSRAMDARRTLLQACADNRAARARLLLAATWTDSTERIHAALSAIGETMGPQPDGATLLGTYLEGPYLNPERCGAQSMQHIRRASREEALAFLDMGVIREVALAPEFEKTTG